MRQELSHTVEPNIGFEVGEIIEQRAHTLRPGIAKPHEQENGEARGKEDQAEDFHHSGEVTPVMKARTLVVLLNQELDQRPMKASAGSCWARRPKLLKRRSADNTPVLHTRDRKP
jgi:hypothetical protein